MDLNDIQDEKFLSSRNWDYLDDNKINDLNKKVDFIYQTIDKNNLNNIKTELDKKTLEEYVDEYNPMDNQYTIGCISSTKFLVEKEEFNSPNDLNELTKYMVKYRPIKGDGECFYRSLIYSILENIILTNKIMQMKELLILYYEKISLDNKLVNEKEYLATIKVMNINIVKEILCLIINQMEIDKLKAYILLLKAFHFYSEFDFGILYFTRYLFYEYISENEDKLYSKENSSIELGSLLPDGFADYSEINNIYFYENYYKLHLMNPKEFAEKIVLYVTPFVFNIRMNILHYKYDENGTKSIIEENKFLNEKKNEYNLQAEINLLYIKDIHYEIYYKYDYYQDNKICLDILLNKKEDMALLGDNNYQKKQEDIQINNIKNEIKPDSDFSLFHEENKYIDEKDKNLNNININSNDKNIIFKEDNLLLNENNKNINNIDDNFNYQDNDDELKEYNKIIYGDVKSNNNNNSNNEIADSINKENNLYFYKKNNNDNNNVKCLECKKPYLKKENIFDICEECFLRQIKPLIFFAFKDFLKDRTNLVDSEQKFKDLLSQKKCKIINQEDLSIYEAISKSKFNLKDILLNLRSNFCLYCGKEYREETEYFIILPCNCKICSSDCFKKYIEKLKEYISLKYDCPVFFNHLNLFSCYCGFVYDTKNILAMIKETEKKKLYEQKEVYQKYLSNFWNWRCFLCKNNFEIRKDFLKVDFECDDIDKSLLNPEQKLKHLLCDECLYKYVINSKKIISCNICKMRHKLVKFNRANEHNEEMEPIEL